MTRVGGGRLPRRRVRDVPARCRTSLVLVVVLVLWPPASGVQDACRADIGALRPGADDADLVLERDDWAGFAPLSLEELLRHFAGVHFARRGGLGSPLYGNILGSVTGQIQIVLDGIEMNEVDANWARPSGIPVACIDRIRVYRTRDPVRIEVWTRESTHEQPVTDLDLARGDFVTRTRRIRFATPERPVQATVAYEELLRGTLDFRVDRTQPLEPGLGSYAGRGRWIDGRLVRPDQDRLTFRHFDFVDDSNGSYDDPTDATHTHRTLNALRWTTRLLGRGLVLDLSNLTWDRSRRLEGDATRWTESHNAVGADWDVVSSSGLEVQTRLRASSASTLQPVGSQAVRLRARQWDAGVEVSRRGWLRWQAAAAVHDNDRHGSTWSGRLRAAWHGDVWTAAATVGRGVSFAGTTMDPDAGESSRAVGHYTAAALERRGGLTRLGLRVWAKDFDGRLGVTQTLFPLLGAGPERVGGLVAHAHWDGSRGPWLFGLGARVSWVPWVQGERGGLPEVQTELVARLARAEWFDGDLSVTLQAVWHAETEREFTASTILGAFQETGFDINVRFLRRIVFFWHIANAWDVLYEAHPNVLMPSRRSLVGVQVLLFN